MEEQKNENTSWLKEELEEVKATAFDEDRKPALKLEENKIVKITVDFTNPFEKWVDNENNTVKKIIPVKVGDSDFVWWLNVKNPVYSQIIEKGSRGQKEFKILQTGSKQTTKYTIIED